MTKKKVDDELGLELEKLAVKLAGELAAGKDVKKPTADMFGKLTTYFAATRRLNLRSDAEEDDDATFDDFRKKINGNDTASAN